ncbi:MAG: nuclear transport factor 2 family protein [Lunatimonas sp.]|uniref:nuclear transport factor 2 family protein n=1 Tax=Lunatimonas sp. TaxID=2060141 RepID=UPI00263AFB24|nr:nuclear transport factor 2 family protein [Lunatimonas sp.]MCC5939011.1 nuclear transport factor 2 family protein [Lunatimonas sp.]
MLKSFVLSLLVLTAVTTQTIAQNKEVAAVEKAVLDLRAAMLSGDAASLTAISSKNITYGHSNGTIEDQAAFVEALASGNNNFTEITLSDQTVEILGKIALVRHNLTGTTHNKGADPASINLGILLVWQKEGKDWKLLARQAFKR